MFELDIKIIHDDWSNTDRVPMPQPFVLVGYQGPYVIPTESGRGPLLIDAEGVALAGGAVYVWCRSTCCPRQPQRWSSIEAAADYHGSFIIEADGTVREPGETYI
ncbi:MAG TPA: hypothetical protein VGL93_17200 [Streptosporangiaceae bacterium]|jgi:hypothetical protein